MTAPMRPDDARPRASDIAEALALLSRWPVPMSARPRGAATAWAWPLAGAAMGLVAGALGAVLGWAGAPVALAAGIALAALIAQTGALHEDGLADCADGFWGAHERARRLEIMRDSRIGAFGALALALSTVMRFALLAELAAAGHLLAALIAAAAASRVPMIALMGALPAARPGGLSATTGRPATSAVLMALGLGAGIAVIAAGGAGIAALLWAHAAGFAWGVVARAKIGGQSGDVLGAAQVLAEIAALSALAALM